MCHGHIGACSSLQNGADVLIPAAESGNIALFDWLVEKYMLDPLEWSKVIKHHS